MTRVFILSLAAAIAISGTLFAAGSRQASVDTAGLLPYTDAKTTALGKTLYADHCASCHGADLQGAPDWKTPDADGYLPAPPHDMTGHTWHHPDAQLIDITTRGTAAVVGQGYKSRMIGFGDVLSEHEIRAVLAYIKSTWPRQVIDAHNDINQGAASR